jgi:hypothetical protein
MRATIAAVGLWAACLAAVHVHSSQPIRDGASQTPKTPDETLAQFASLDADGGQLTLEGWKSIADLFASPGERRSHIQLTVISHYHVVKAAMRGDRMAEGRINYTHLGFLDVSTGVFTSEHAGLHLRGDYKLLRFDRPSLPPVWKIEGAIPTPAITRMAALRYVKGMIQKTSDRTVARNFRAARIALERLR